MVKHTVAICRHFVGLALKRLSFLDTLKSARSNAKHENVSNEVKSLFIPIQDIVDYTLYKIYVVKWVKVNF